MNIIAVYVFPTVPGPHFDNACRFVASYNQHPAGAEHRLLVVSNGGPPSLDMRALIDQIDHPVEVLEHDNSGWDIGAFEAAAAHYPCDMMVFFGTTAYLRGPGWLKRMAEAFDRHGPACLYGSTANNGNLAIGVHPHIRTTGFFLAPLLLNVYPLRVTEPSQRYASEHGMNCLTAWFWSKSLPTFMVTWDGEYQWPSWDQIRNGYHNGDQSNIIVGDRLTCPPFYPSP